MFMFMLGTTVCALRVTNIDKRRSKGASLVSLAKDQFSLC